MHDFILAKEIAKKVTDIARKNKLEKISQIVLELGTISLAHDEFGEHVEDISIDNLKFGLEEILKQSGYAGFDLQITKIEGGDWRLISMA
jgi:Zn finger protein HypA/HybF involved in hydrogenase expression